MTKPIIRIYTTVDEFIDREMTAAEYKIYEAEQKLYAEAKVQAKAKAIAKAALLDKLGITAEEAQLLLA